MSTIPAKMEFDDIITKLIKKKRQSTKTQGV